MSDVSRTLGNVVVVILLAFGAAWLADKIAIWLGWRPWAVCGLAAMANGPTVQALLLLLLTVGVVLFLLSGFRSRTAVILAGVALLSVTVPRLASVELGGFCNIRTSNITAEIKTLPTGL